MSLVFVKGKYSVLFKIGANKGISISRSVNSMDFSPAPVGSHLFLLSL